MDGTGEASGFAAAAGCGGVSVFSAQLLMLRALANAIGIDDPAIFLTSLWCQV
ncbi:MAG: hypothetical protein ACREOR_00530 [Candidatus Binatia bacterium]